MFKVRYKIDQLTYKVYDIKTDKSGYPTFLIFKNNQWIWKSAKYFIPYDI